MEKDNVAIGLGIPFLILILLTWLTGSSIEECNYYHPCIPWIYTYKEGLFILVGLLMSIPVFVLTIIFLSTQTSSCERGAFGLSIISWFLIIIGTIIGLCVTISDYLIPSLLIAFICPQIILELGLFARRNYGQNTNPPQRSYEIYPNRSFVSPKNSPRGHMVIPEAVRMAGTQGQSIKRCVQCKNTLDIKTMVCYFCGAKQPDQPLNAPPQRLISPEGVHSDHSPLSRGKPLEQFAFCPHCGTKVFRGHLFCTQCGASLAI